MTDDELRRQYQGGLTRRAAMTPEMSVEQVEALAAGRLPEAEALRLLDQIMADEGLRAEYELLRAIHAAGRSSTAHRRRWQLGVGIAATFLLATVGVLAYVGTRGDRAETRGADSAVELLAPEEQTPAVIPFTLAWRPVAGAVGYRVELLAEDGTVTLTRTVGDTVLVLTAGEAPASGTYQWWVEARVPSGHVRSTLRRLTLQGP